MPKGRDEMGTKTSKKRSKKMNQGLQFRSLQFGSNTPRKSGDSSSWDSKLTSEQREKLKQFGRNAKTIIVRAVELLRADVARMPSIHSIQNDFERETLIDSMFQARYGKSPRDYEESMFIQTTIKFSQTL